MVKYDNYVHLKYTAEKKTYDFRHSQNRMNSKFNKYDIQCISMKQSKCIYNHAGNIEKKIEHRIEIQAILKK